MTVTVLVVTDDVGHPWVGHLTEMLSADGLEVETMLADSGVTRHLEVARDELEAVVVVVTGPDSKIPSEIARYSRLIPRFYWAAPSAVGAPPEAGLTSVVIDGTRNWARRIRRDLRPG
jgi:hypothetical protein